MVTDFNIVADEVTKSVGTVTSNIEELSTAVSAVTESTISIAESMSNISFGKDEALTNSNDNKEKSYKLLDSVSKFKL